MHKILSFVVVASLFLVGCNEQKKIETLQNESALLEKTVDSLKTEIKKAGTDRVYVFKCLTEADQEGRRHREKFPHRSRYGPRGRGTVPSVPAP